VCIGSWLGNRRKRDHWGELGVDGWFILGWMCGEKPVYSSFVGNPEGKKPLGRRRRRMLDNIRMALWGEGLYRFLEGKPEGKRPLG
jgi:hypothetical protein